MRILFTKQLPLDTPGGETTHLLALARCFQDLGADVYIMAVTAHKTPVGIWPADKTIEVQPFGFHYFFDCLPLSKAAAKFAQEHSVDLVLGWQYETALLPEFARNRDFTFAIIAAAPFGTIKRKAHSLFRKLIYDLTYFRPLRHADIIFCASEFAKKELVTELKIPAQKIKIVPIGIDEIFQPASRPPVERLSRFIFSGSLEPLKGIFDALTALAIVKERGYQDWTLTVIGWEDPTAIIQFAREHQIDDHIQIRGGLSRAELAKELTKAQLAILPSHTETFGLSIAEAQACGLPVISYRTGAIPEVVIDRITGILVPPYNQELLADAIIELINNPESAQNMGIQGQKYVRKQFSWGKTAIKMLDLMAQN